MAATIFSKCILTTKSENGQAVKRILKEFDLSTLDSMCSSSDLDAFNFTGLWFNYSCAPNDDLCDDDPDINHLKLLSETWGESFIISILKNFDVYFSINGAFKKFYSMKRKPDLSQHMNRFAIKICTMEEEDESSKNLPIVISLEKQINDKQVAFISHLMETTKKNKMSPAHAMIIGNIEKNELDIGYDLRASENLEFKRGDHVVLKLEESIIPVGNVFGLLVLRSSQHKRLICNSGIIDLTYSGPLMMHAFAIEDGVIEKGERVAQFVPINLYSHQIYTHEEGRLLSNRGKQGFGSSGTK